MRLIYSNDGYIYKEDLRYKGYQIYLNHNNRYRITYQKHHKKISERILTLDDIYPMRHIIGYINDYPVKVIDMLVGNEASLAVDDWYFQHVKHDTGWTYDNAYK